MFSIIRDQAVTKKKTMAFYSAKNPVLALAR
jgi:hypothetical protein